jgi:hypothetical protein
MNVLIGYFLGLPISAYKNFLSSAVNTWCAGLGHSYSDQAETGVAINACGALIWALRATFTPESLKELSWFLRTPP